MYDIVVIGSGPAGLSAALNARARNKTVLVLGNHPRNNPLWKAELVDNHLGQPNVTGAQLLQSFVDHAEARGAELRTGRVLSVVQGPAGFFVSVGSDYVEGRAVILATGVARGRKYPGEAEFLGAGVSYCATCDGMLYRGKKVAVLGFHAEAQEEAEYLRSIGCTVLYFDQPRPYEIGGSNGKVDRLILPGESHAVDGVFVLRPTLAPTDLLPGLALQGNYLAVDRTMATNLTGVYACGDCTGLPLQVSKAVGEGLVAGQQAANYVDKLKQSE